MKFVDTCKVALDKDQDYGAVLTDLSKAFDCLPYRLTVSKLHAYGVDDKACMLIASYFSNGAFTIAARADATNMSCELRNSQSLL